MRQLLTLIHLLVTAWVAYLMPWFLLMGIDAYFPSLSVVARTALYVALALGAALLGGTILGRSVAWRARRLLLAAFAWIIATADTANMWLAGALTNVQGEGIVLPTAAFAASILWALGMSAGLYVGGNHVRTREAAVEPPNTSLERTRER